MLVGFGILSILLYILRFAYLYISIESEKIVGLVEFAKTPTSMFLGFCCEMIRFRMDSFTLVGNCTGECEEIPVLNEISVKMGDI